MTTFNPPSRLWDRHASPHLQGGNHFYLQGSHGTNIKGPGKCNPLLQEEALVWDCLCTDLMLTPDTYKL